MSALQTMRPANLLPTCILVFFTLLYVQSSMFNSGFARPKKKMPKQRGTPRRGSTSRGSGRCKANIGDTDGFVVQVPLPIHCMIDEWESKVVSDHLASGKSNDKINHY